MEWSSQLHRLVSHNEDLKRLVEKGYAIALDNNHLIIRDILDISLYSLPVISEDSLPGFQSKVYHFVCRLIWLFQFKVYHLGTLGLTLRRKVYH